MAKVYIPGVGYVDTGGQLSTNAPQPSSGLAAPAPAYISPGMAEGASSVQNGNNIAAQQAAAVAAAQQAAYQGQQARAVSQWGFNPLAPGGGTLGTPSAGASLTPAGPPPLIKLPLVQDDTSSLSWMKNHGIDARQILYAAAIQEGRDKIRNAQTDNAVMNFGQGLNATNTVWDEGSHSWIQNPDQKKTDNPVEPGLDTGELKNPDGSPTGDKQSASNSAKAFTLDSSPVDPNTGKPNPQDIINQKTHEVVDRFWNAVGTPDVHSEQGAWNKAFSDSGLSGNDKFGKAVLTAMAAQADATDANFAQDQAQRSQQGGGFLGGLGKLGSAIPGFLLGSNPLTAMLPGAKGPIAGAEHGIVDPIRAAIPSSVGGLNDQQKQQYFAQQNKILDSPLGAAFAVPELGPAIEGALKGAGFIAGRGVGVASDAAGALASKIPQNVGIDSFEALRAQKALQLAREAAPELHAAAERPNIFQTVVDAMGGKKPGAEPSPVPIENTPIPPGGKDPFQKPLPDLISKTEPTPTTTPIVPPQPLNPINMAVNRIRNVLESAGEGGRKISQALQGQRDFAETTGGRLENSAPTAFNRKLVSEDDFQLAQAVAAGKVAAKDVSPVVARAGKELRATYNEVQRTAVTETADAKGGGLNIKEDKTYVPGGGYEDLKKNLPTNEEKYGQMVKDIAKKNGIEESQAKAYLDNLRNSDGDFSKFHNLESPRTITPPRYANRSETLDYLHGSANRIGEIKHFGRDGEQLQEHLAQIGDERGGKAMGEATDLTNIATGTKKYNPVTDKLSRVARAYNTLTKLGRGAITNAGQTANTIAVGGLGRTLKNLPAALAPRNTEMGAAARARGLEAGTTNREVIQQLKQGSGITKGWVGKVGAPFFNRVESFNRRLATLVGDDFADHVAAKAAQGNGYGKRALANLVGDSEAERIMSAGGKLSDADRTLLSRRFVHNTQFKVDPQDLPGWASSPTGRNVMQFRQFAYNQTAMVTREVLQEAQHGNFAPLLRYVAVGVPVGEGVSDVKDLIGGKGFQKMGLGSRLLRDITQVGGAGLASDVVKGMLPPTYLSPGRMAGSYVSTLLGPTAGTLSDLGLSAAEAMKGNPKNLEKFGLSQLGLAGTIAKNTLLPSLNYDDKLLGNNSNVKQQKQFTGLISKANSTDAQNAANGVLNNYEQSYQAGNTSGPHVELTDQEKKYAALFVSNGTFDSNKKNVDNRILNLIQDPQARAAAESAWTKMKEMTYQVDQLTTDQTKSQNEQNTGQTGDPFENWKNNRGVGNADANQNFLQFVTSFNNGSKSDQIAFLQDPKNAQLLNSPYPDATRMGLPEGTLTRDYLTGLINQQDAARSASGGKYESPAEQIMGGRNAQEIGIAGRQNPDVTYFAGQSDPNQRAIMAANPGLAGLSPQADAYQQALINAGLISPYTKGNQTYTPGQAIYTGKGQNRSGINPQDLLSGATKLKAGGSGGGGRRGGGKRGGRSGGIRMPRVKTMGKPRMASVRKGGGSPPSILGLPRISPGRVRPLDQTVQNLKQMQGAGSPADLMNVMHPQQILKPVNPLNILFPKKKKARA